jgi:hypothetical protein
MTDAELNMAIEVAGEAVYGGFADDDSFEHLLARAVLILSSRLKSELEAYTNLMEEIEGNKP